MKKYLIAAALIVGFSAPVLALETNFHHVRQHDQKIA